MWKRIAEWTGEPRVIADREADGPYLSRYYIRGRPYMADGSIPWNRYGDMRPGVFWPKGPGVMLHCFHRSDNALDPHSHPWKWAVSLILSGGYDEERWDPVAGKIVTRRFLPGSINVLRLDDFHRVDLLAKECWSLFITGPRYSSWGFRLRKTGEFVPHREYIARTRAGDNGVERR